MVKPLNELYKIPKEQNKLLTANIKVDETLLHKFVKIVYQTKLLEIEFYMGDGSKVMRHKAIKSILNNGVIINKYIYENNRDQETKLFMHKFNKIKNVKAIKIIGDPKYYKNKIAIEIFE